MSTHGTPASDFGRLALGGSSTSSSGEMPVTTRAMRRGHGNPSSSQSSSRTTAGASRNTAQSSRTQRGVMASRRPPDDSGGDESSSSDESDEDDAATLLNRQVALATYETVAALGVQRQTPSELSSARRDNVQRRLADAMIERFRDQTGVQSLRSILTQQQCLDAVRSNLRQRYNTIVSGFMQNVSRPAEGHDVPTTLAHFRGLANAIGNHITYCDRIRVDGGKRELVGLLLEILLYITRDDRDLYAEAGVPRPQYAGSGNTGNLFRKFVSEHMNIMEVCTGVSTTLLREHIRTFHAIMTKVAAHGPSNGDRAHFMRLRAVLNDIWNRIQPQAD